MLVGSLSDVMVHCGDVLNIHCNIGSALRITRCRLLRTDHNKHRHLDTCSESPSNKPNGSLCDEFQLTEQKEPASPDQQSCSSQGQHLEYCHYPPGLCSSELHTELRKASDSDFVLGMDQVINSQAGNTEVSCGLVNDCMNGAATSQISLPNFRTKEANWFYMDRAAIGYLNDVVWFDSCLTALRQLINCQNPPQVRLQLIILSQIPLLFPIAALRLGLVSSLCFVDLDPVHRPLIGRLLAANEVSEDHVTYGRPRQRDVTCVLFADIVSPEGCLRQNVFELLNAARCVLSAISPLVGGLA